MELGVYDPVQELEATALSNQLQQTVWETHLAIQPSKLLHRIDVAALCAALRDWIVAQILGSAAGLDHLIPPVSGKLSPF
jgi:exonuclease III